MPASTKTQRMDLPQEGTNSSLLRETGIMPLPQIPWGGHLCLFYDSKDDLLDTCVRGFEAGLAGRDEKLTRREYMVLTQIVRGASSKEAARVLGITSRTVDFHRANILKKLRARNIADLVRRVME